MIFFLQKPRSWSASFPLNADTEGILNASLFAALPREACLINAARGRHLIENDLIEALDREQLSSATLDVSETNPRLRKARSGGMTGF
ncbi:MAG: NAD(P)-dependent oxidoreductase [Alphaproteobacteria bacterium]